MWERTTLWLSTEGWVQQAPTKVAHALLVGAMLAPCAVVLGIGAWECQVSAQDEGCETSGLGFTSVGTRELM
eukprot:677964-Amphidinium_carterae.1